MSLGVHPVMAASAVMVGTFGEMYSPGMIHNVYVAEIATKWNASHGGSPVDVMQVISHTSVATLVSLIVMLLCIWGVAIFLKARGLDKIITMRSLMATYFFPNTLVIKKISGKILKEYLERSAQFWTISNDEIVINPMMDYPTPQYHNYDLIDGVEYTIKVSNPIGQRIVSLTRNGVPIKDDDEFTIAINNYRSSGSGGYEMIKNAPTVKEINRSVIDLISDYILNHQEIDFEPENNIKVIK